MSLGKVLALAALAVALFATAPLDRAQVVVGIGVAPIAIRN